MNRITVGLMDRLVWYLIIIIIIVIIIIIIIKYTKE